MFTKRWQFPSDTPVLSTIRPVEGPRGPPDPHQPQQCGHSGNDFLAAGLNDVRSVSGALFLDCGHRVVGLAYSERPRLRAGT